jgi:MFS family permease
VYSQQDLNSAVAAGAISAEAADALRAHVAAQNDSVPADAEHFRLITGFNDVFVSIGVVILLVAMAAIGGSIYESTAGPSPAGAALVAGTSWLLAEFFTRKKRMALPSIILLLAFVGGVFSTLVALSLELIGNDPARETVGVLLIALAGLITAAAAWFHWKRFMVPITIAAGTAALAATVVALIVAVIGPNSDNVGDVVLGIVFGVGLAIFAFAMRWDMSDPARGTRRSDVAFWLHLLAAPMIAHPVFVLIGVTDGRTFGPGAALAVLAVYIAFGLVALAVDRRALLVSALAYVLIALTLLFDRFGAVELSFALTALVIGSALLTLSAMWTPIRRAVVGALPGSMSVRLPATA